MKGIIMNYRKDWRTKLSISLMTLLLCNIDAVMPQTGSLAQAQINPSAFRSASGIRLFLLPKHPAPDSTLVRVQALRPSYLYATSDNL